MAGALIVAPELAARQTGEVLGGVAVLEPALRDIDQGDWAGRSFGDICAVDPDGFTAWIANPAAGTPGGESLADVAARVAPWLAGCASDGVTVRVVAAPTTIRIMIALALDIPPAAALRIDIAPLSMTILSFNRSWRLQAIRPA